MIRINNFLHRQQLLEITRRWFHNRLHPEDLGSLKALINYNSIWIGRVSQEFASGLFRELAGKEVQAQPVNTKGELKDFLVSSLPYEDERIASLCRRYQERPERYFRETPFLGVLYSAQRSGRPAYVGSTRIKRIRRIAEKGARRISDYIFEQIKERATSSGRGPSWSSTPGFAPDDMLVELERAERRIGLELQRGRLFQERLEFVLEDVLGVKVIAENHEQARVIRLLEQNPRCQILEIEQHRGRYNATNVVFQYLPDKEPLIAPALAAASIERLQWRGMDPARIHDDFKTFVREGESAIHIELIITSFKELLESEIGRSMHEDRLMRQRIQTYRGHLARNVSYLMEYIFACAISPCTSIEELPIKIWIQYVPDYFDEVIKRLFKIPTFRAVE